MINKFHRDSQRNFREKETSVLSLLDSAGDRNQLVDLFTKNHIAPAQLQEIINEKFALKTW